MSDRRIIRITLMDEYRDLSLSLPDAVEEFTKMLDEVPPEYRKDSRFEIETEDDYYGGGSRVTIRAFYDRPETDEEMAARHAEAEANAVAARRHNEAQERAIYEQLRRKYG